MPILHEVWEQWERRDRVTLQAVARGAPSSWRLCPGPGLELSLRGILVFGRSGPSHRTGRVGILASDDSRGQIAPQVWVAHATTAWVEWIEVTPDPGLVVQLEFVTAVRRIVANEDGPL